MAKTTQQELTLANGSSAQGAALVVPESLKGGALITGGSSQVQISRLAMYQGTPEEEQTYPDSGLKRGDFFDVLEVRRVGVKVQIVPIFGWMSWAKFVKGQRVPVYSHTSKAQVPPEDLEWHDKNPPEATECVNVVCVAQGEAWPYLMVFKRTGLRAWNKTISPMEARRGAQAKGPGLYELSGVDDKNAFGQAFKRLSARYVGDPTGELLTLAGNVKKNLDAFKKVAEEQAREAEGSSQEVDAPF